MSTNVITTFIGAFIASCLIVVATTAQAQSPQVPVEWHFAWDTLMAPDQVDALKDYPLRDATKNWNQDCGNGQGKATYYCRLSGLDTSQRLGLKIFDVCSSYRLFVNGKEAASVGIVGNTAETTQARYLSRIIDLPKNSEVELVMQVANFHHARGGMNTIPVLQPIELLVKKQRWLNFGAAAIAAAFLFMGLTISGTLRIHKANTLAGWFALICVAMAYRTIGTEEYILHHLFQDLPFSVSTSIEYISYYLMVWSFWEICYQVLGDNISKVVMKVVRISFSLLILTAIVLPSVVFTSFLFLAHILSLCSLVYGLFVFLLFRKKGHAGSEYAFVGFLTFVVAASYAIYSNITGGGFSNMLVYGIIGIELLLTRCTVNYS